MRNISIEMNSKKPTGWQLEDTFSSVVLNQYGYYELRNMNTPEERLKRFEQSYFQEYAGVTYEKVYSEEELQDMNRKYEEKEYMIRENLPQVSGEGNYSLLDIACGEGYLMKFFQDKGVQVKGIDVGCYALEQHNPNLLPFFEQGDMNILLAELAKRGEIIGIFKLA